MWVYVFMSDYKAKETFQCGFLSVMLISLTSRKDVACMDVFFVHMCLIRGRKSERMQTLYVSVSRFYFFVCMDVWMSFFVR